jgi:hypothetical protein
MLPALLVTAGSRLASGQAPAPTAKPKVAYVRFWNMMPDHKKDVLQLALGPNQPLTTAGASNSSAGYTPILPNTYTFSVQRVGEHQDTKTPAVRMVDGSFFTILATPKNGQINLEVIDDTIDPSKEDGSARLVVRQYVPGARTVITVGSNPSATMNYGDVLTFDHLPAGQVPIVIQIALPNGAARNVTTSADLTKNHHGEFILVEDSYARFRPFFAADGETSLNLESVMR